MGDNSDIDCASCVESVAVKNTTAARNSQGFRPVTFTTGPTAQWGQLRKRGDDRINSLHGNLGHMTASPCPRVTSKFAAACLPPTNNDEGWPLAASTTGRHVAFLYPSGGPYFHINYFIIVISIIQKNKWTRKCLARQWMVFKLSRGGLVEGVHSPIPYTFFCVAVDI